jgi:hypothetical protein
VVSRLPRPVRGEVMADDQDYLILEIMSRLVRSLALEGTEKRRGVAESRFKLDTSVHTPAAS